MFVGKAHKFGNNIDTDAIIPARHLNTHDPEELAKHVMEDADPHFTAKAKPNDIIVAGDNFGCGSSREHAPVAIKAFGISAVIARSFARIFYRNAINIGLPILESKDAVDGIKEGDEIEIDLSKGLIRNVTTKKEYRSTPFPPFMQGIIDAGGLIEYVRKKIHG